MAWTKLKSLLGRDLGGPSLLPTKVWGARRGFTLVLVASLAVLAVDQAWLRTPPPPYKPPPSPTPTTAPHFALDDIDLGPGVRLTRFYPNDNLFDGFAVEAGDGQLYVNYAAGLSPAQWGMEVPCCSAVGILNQGHITPLSLSPSSQKARQYLGSAHLEGLWRGMPIVHLADGTIAGNRYIAISPAGIVALPHRPPVSTRPSPCIGFDGGRVCNIMSGISEVSISLPGRANLLIKGARYLDSPPYSGTPETGSVRLVGGGRHHFLLVEYHIGQDAAECLEGEVP